MRGLWTTPLSSTGGLAGVRGMWVTSIVIHRFILSSDLLISASGANHPQSTAPTTTDTV